MFSNPFYSGARLQLHYTTKYNSEARTVCQVFLEGTPQGSFSSGEWKLNCSDLPEAMTLRNICVMGV